VSDLGEHKTFLASRSPTFSASTLICSENGRAGTVIFVFFDYSSVILSLSLSLVWEIIKINK
jgi:hypothetical protein